MSFRPPSFARRWPNRREGCNRSARRSLTAGWWRASERVVNMSRCVASPVSASGRAAYHRLSSGRLPPLLALGGGPSAPAEAHGNTPKRSHSVIDGGRAVERVAPPQPGRPNPRSLVLTLGRRRDRAAGRGGARTGDALRP